MNNKPNIIKDFIKSDKYKTSREILSLILAIIVAITIVNINVEYSKILNIIFCSIFILDGIIYALISYQEGNPLDNKYVFSGYYELFRYILRKNNYRKK